jgi:hypothetical protein
MLKTHWLAPLALAALGTLSPVTAATLYNGLTRIEISAPLGTGGAVITYTRDVAEETVATAGDPPGNLGTASASPLASAVAVNAGDVVEFKAEVSGATDGAAGLGTSNTFALSGGFLRMVNPTNAPISLLLELEFFSDLSTSVLPQPFVSDFVSTISTISIFYENIIDYDESFVIGYGDSFDFSVRFGLAVDLPASAERLVRTSVSVEGIARSVPAPVPLPAPVAMLGVAVAALGLLRRRG